MEHPTGVDPPADNAARCYRYTSSDEDDNRPAPTTNDRVAGKRPMAVGLSQAGAMLAGAAPGLVTGEGSASGSRASKRHRLLQVIDDDDEEEEAAPTLVRRPRSCPDVAPTYGGRIAQDPPTTHVEHAHPSKVEAGAVTGRAMQHVFMASHRSSNL